MQFAVFKQNNTFAPTMKSMHFLVEMEFARNPPFEVIIALLVSVWTNIKWLVFNLRAGKYYAYPEEKNRSCVRFEF